MALRWRFNIAQGVLERCSMSIGKSRLFLSNAGYRAGLKANMGYEEDVRRSYHEKS
jgi:hypothetical protein